MADGVLRTKSKEFAKDIVKKAVAKTVAHKQAIISYLTENVSAKSTTFNYPSDIHSSTPKHTKKSTDLRSRYDKPL